MLILKFVLAFCSLSYELILAQGLSAFLDNTVLRYSTTIGLYMFTMGVGAWISSRTDARRPSLILWQVEIALTVIGAGSLPCLFLLSWFDTAALVVMVWAYLLVALTGLLTGFELPLMLMLSARKGSPSRGRIIGIDYAGAFAATVVFVFCFYPFAGLMRSAMAVAVLNALAAVFVAVRWREDFSGYKGRVLMASAVVTGTALVLLLSSRPLESQLAALYLRAGY